MVFCEVEGGSYMKYQEPEMVIIKFIDQSVIITSIGQGGTSTEENTPGVDF